MKNKTLLSAVLMFLVSVVSHGYSSPKTEFDYQWTYGLESYVSEHYSNFRGALVLYQEVVDILEARGCEDSQFVAAIVFPELMRYSEYRDRIEALTTELMYSAGVEYFNCSIGYMQMKPVFCVDIEQRIAKSAVLKNMFPEIDFAGNEETVESRYRRVVRMKQLETQCLYLMAFVRICNNLYGLEGKDDMYRLRIISTAYNCGIRYNLSQVEYISQQPAFPAGTGNSKSRWIYCNIVMDFYEALLDGTLNSM